MSQLTTNTTTIDELIALANNLPDAGSGGGGGLETCQVTIRHEWGGNEDPEFLYLHVTAYNVENGVAVPYYQVFNSNYDFELSHVITLTMYKNMPFTIDSHSKNGSASYWITVTANGGQLERRIEMDAYDVIYQLIPTDDTATFIFSSP